MSSSSRLDVRRRTRRTALASVVVAAVALTGACGKDADPGANTSASASAGASGSGGAASDDFASGTAAEVNGQTIEAKPVQEAVDRGLKGEGVQRPAPVLRSDTLTRRIRVALFKREAERMGVDVTDAEREKTKKDLEERTKQGGGLVKAAAAEGIAEPEIAEVVDLITYERVLGEKLIKDKPVTDAELRKIYDENKEQIEVAEASHILVEDKALADKLLKQLQDGGDFAALAKKHSTDKGSGAQGGVLGPAPRNKYVPEFEKAVWESKIGEVVGPVKTQFGYHLIKVTKRPTVEESLKAIKERATPQIAHERLIEAMKKDAKVTVDKRFGTWDDKELAVVPPPGADAPATPGASPSAGAGAPADPEDPSSPQPSPSS